MQQVRPEQYGWDDNDETREEYLADGFRWRASPELIEGYVEHWMATWEPNTTGRRKKSEREAEAQRRQDLEAMLSNQAAFLAAFAETGNRTLACGAVPMARSRLYAWLEDTTPVGIRFRQLFAMAKEQAVERLEAEARRRAVHGSRRVRRHYSKEGDLISEDIEIQYSDTLLIFLLKGAAPEKYRERMDITGNVKHELEIQAQELADKYGLDKAALVAEAEQVLEEIRGGK